MEKLTITGSIDEISFVAAKITMVMAFAAFLPFIIVWGMPGPIVFFDPVEGSFGVTMGNWALSILAFGVAIIVGAFIHELIHALFFLPFLSSGFKGLSFGISKKNLALYVHIKEPLSIWGFRTGVIMPFILLGIVPLIAGLFTGSFFVFLFGFIMAQSAAGDLFLIQKAWRLHSGYFIEDMSDAMGFIATPKAPKTP
ncbi:DUF3267 domain-containing protein [Balneolaceae bacterium ANBcel3]|nr:DUF3267 domain-containing protein [Balneolaceae bacterium ANBcel3]